MSPIFRSDRGGGLPMPDFGLMGRAIFGRGHWKIRPKTGARHRRNFYAAKNGREGRRKRAGKFLSPGIGAIRAPSPKKAPKTGVDIYSHKQAQKQPK